MVGFQELPVAHVFIQFLYHDEGNDPALYTQYAAYGAWNIFPIVQHEDRCLILATQFIGHLICMFIFSHPFSLESLDLIGDCCCDRFIFPVRIAFGKVIDRAAPIVVVFSLGIYLSLDGIDIIPFRTHILYFKPVGESLPFPQQIGWNKNEGRTGRHKLREQCLPVLHTIPIAYRRQPGRLMIPVHLMPIEIMFKGLQDIKRDSFEVDGHERSLSTGNHALTIMIHIIFIHR